jgi:hypothetical protein
MGGYSGLPPTEFIPKARAAAQRALELDERLPEAHTALAVIAQTYDWDWPTAEKEYRRAHPVEPKLRHCSPLIRRVPRFAGAFRRGISPDRECQAA